jgi:hypothetical protein
MLASITGAGMMPDHRLSVAEWALICAGLIVTGAGLILSFVQSSNEYYLNLALIGAGHYSVRANPHGLPAFLVVIVGAAMLAFAAGNAAYASQLRRRLGQTIDGTSDRGSAT